MLHQIARGVILASMLALGACASAPGAYNGLSKDPMHTIVVAKNPLYGDLTDTDYNLTVRMANACKGFADQQMASVFETMGVSAVANAAGGAGLGPAAKHGFGHLAKAGEYSSYGSWAGFFSGLPYGAQLQSSAKTSLIGSCTNAFLQDPKARQITGGGMHAFSSFVRSSNTSAKPPTWVKPASSTPALTDRREIEDSFTAPGTPPR